MTNPANKTALITGAGGGFGRHMVRQFRAAGAKLILTDVSEDALQGALDDAGDALVDAIVADLSSEAGCDKIAAACRAVGDRASTEEPQANLLAPHHLLNHGCFETNGAVLRQLRLISQRSYRAGTPCTCFR